MLPSFPDFWFFDALGPLNPADRAYDVLLTMITSP